MKLNLTIIVVFLFGILLFSFSSCEFINPEEPIPSYIQIDTVLLSSPSSITGSNKHRITDVWVSVGNNFIGAFSLPATIPVLEADSQLVIIDPGIIEDGRVELREIYPFYTRYSKNHLLIPGEVTIVQPTLSYLDSDLMEVLILEDFDSGSGSIFGEDLDGNSGTAFNITTSSGLVFEGAGSGVVELSGSNDQLIAGTNAPYFNVGLNTKRIFMEITYKNDSPIEIGVLGYNSSYEILNNTFFLGLSSSDEWKKVYINLMGPVNSLRPSFGLTNFQVALKMEASNANPTTINYFDNIKIIREK